MSFRRAPDVLLLNDGSTSRQSDISALKLQTYLLDLVLTPRYQETHHGSERRRIKIGCFSEGSELPIDLEGRFFNHFWDTTLYSYPSTKKPFQYSNNGELPFDVAFLGDDLLEHWKQRPDFQPENLYEILMQSSLVIASPKTAPLLFEVCELFEGDSNTRSTHRGFGVLSGHYRELNRDMQVAVFRGDGSRSYLDPREFWMHQRGELKNVSSEISKIFAEKIIESDWFLHMSWYVQPKFPTTFLVPSGWWERWSVRDILGKSLVQDGSLNARTRSRNVCILDTSNSSYTSRADEIGGWVSTYNKVRILKPNSQTFSTEGLSADTLIIGGDHKRSIPASCRSVVAAMIQNNPDLDIIAWGEGGDILFENSKKRDDPSNAVDPGWGLLPFGIERTLSRRYVESQPSGLWTIGGKRIGGGGTYNCMKISRTQIISFSLDNTWAARSFNPVSVGRASSSPALPGGL